MPATCHRCTAAMIDEATLCHHCTDHLAGRLLDVPIVLAELDVTLSKQARLTSPARSANGRNSVHPDLTVSEAAGGLKSSCAGWAHVLDGYVGRAPWAYLWERLDGVRLQTWALHLDQDLANRMTLAWVKVDKPEDRWYAGVCGAELNDEWGIVECGRVLWAALTDVDISCPSCRSRYTVAQRRETLIRAAEDCELNSRAVASVVSYVLQERLPDSTVRSWSLRGLLVPRQRVSGERVYRVGDVVARAMARDTQGVRGALEEVGA